MGGRRQRTVLNEPAHTRHLRGRDPTEGPGLVLVGHERRPPTQHRQEAPLAHSTGATCPQADECPAPQMLVTQSLTDTIFHNLARSNNKVVHLTAVETQIARGCNYPTRLHATRPRRTCPQPQYS